MKGRMLVTKREQL